VKTARTHRIVFLLAITIFLLGSGVATFSSDSEQVIKITAKRFEYNPNEIRIKKGVPVVLEFTTLDRLHGFSCPDLGLRTDIPPGKVTRLRLVPDKVGTFPFHCDIFCGDGHEDMTGKFIVEE
jgi:cytochrome c oxidase subunit 2